MKQKIVFPIFLLVIVSLSLASAQEFFISPSVIETSLQEGAAQEMKVAIDPPAKLEIQIDQQFQDIITAQLTQNEIVLTINKEKKAEQKVYTGFIKLKSINQEKSIPVIISIEPKTTTLDLSLDFPLRKLSPSDELKATLEIVNLGNFPSVPLDITHQIKDLNSNILTEKKELKVISEEELAIPIKLTVPQAVTGTYILYSEIKTSATTLAIAKSFTILESPQEQKPDQKYTPLSWIAVIMTALILIYLLIRIFSRKALRKYYLFLLIILLIISFFTIPRLSKDEEPSIVQNINQSKIPANITEQLEISDLTYEPFLRKAASNFIIYIVNTSEIIKPEIEVSSSNSEIIISLGDARLEISKLGSKYDFKLVTQSPYPIQCNLICIWKLVFFTETIVTVMLALLIAVYIKKKGKIAIIEKPEESLLEIIQEAESNLNKTNIFKTIKDFFVRFLNIEYEPTIEQIVHEINKSTLPKKVKTQMPELVIKLNELEYNKDLALIGQVREDFRLMLSSIKIFMEKSYKHQKPGIKQAKKRFKWKEYQKKKS